MKQINIMMTQKKQLFLNLVIAAIYLMVFVVDIETPRGIVTCIAYIPLIFLSTWLKNPRASFVFAFWGTLLTILAVFMKTASSVEIWMMVVNRILTIGSLLCVAILTYFYRRADNAMQKGENRLVAVIESSSDAIITKGLDGIITSWNGGAKQLFGYSADEVIGQHINILIPEDRRAEDTYIIGEVKSGRRVEHYETIRVAKNGLKVEISLSVSPLYDADGVIVGASKIARDITEHKQAERRLKEEAARVLAITDTVLDGLITIDSKGNIQTFNPAAVRIFGYQPRDVIGQNVKILMPEPYHSGHDGYIKNYLNTGDKKIIGLGREVTAKRKDGTIFPMELGINEMSIQGERMFVGTIRDITQRKETERRIREDAIRMSAVMNTVLDGLITIDEDGLIQSFNPASVRIFGYQPEEVIGRNVKILMPEPYHSGHDGYLHNYMKSGNAKVIGIGREVLAKRKDGTIFPIELGVNEMQVVGKRMFVGTIRDISVRKNNEQEIKQFLESLERSNQELDDFAYIASHDLKEPLRGLSNNANFLKEDCQDKLDAESAKRLDRMVYLCERMERLVNDLLYFSRLGRQDMAVQKTDLNEVIKDIESMMETTLSEANASIMVDKKLPTIVCDLPRITEVYRNLITNAVKYNDKKDKRIEIGCNEQAGEQVFYVRDNGIGISQQFYEDVFRIFKRLNEESDNVKGTGVGLTFVKKIIERHGGHIWIESEMGKGTTFYFTINQPKGEVQ